MEQLANVLQSLADQLGTTVEMLWGILVSGSRTDGVVMLCGTIFVIVFVAITVLIVIRPNEAEKGETMVDELKFLVVLKIVMIPLSILLVLIVLAIFQDMMRALFNPEYYALMQILDMLGMPQ